MSYYAEIGDRGLTEIDVVMYSQPAWARVEELFIGRLPDGTVHSEVTVAGHPADLYVVRGSRYPIDLARLIIYFGDTVVRVHAHAERLPDQPTVEVNPPVDRATLLSVMSQLRPYPE